MALGDDPYGTPVAEGDIQQAEAPDVAGLAGQWRDWMAEPGNRQAIMQFGINMMQPVAYGQSAAGHFGQAVGAAGEAVDRFQTAEYREREQVRKEAETKDRGDIGVHRAESYRKGQEAAQERARANTIRAQSSVDLTKARADKLVGEANMLKIMADREPDLRVKRQLEQAHLIAKTESERALAEHRQKQTELSDVRVGIQQQNADTASRRVDVSEEQGNRAGDQRDQRLQLQREQLEEVRKKWTTMTPAQREAAYTNHTLFGGKMTYEEFTQRAAGGAPPTAGAKPPATGAPAGGSAKPVTAVDDKGVTRTWNPAKGPKSDPKAWE